MGRTKGGKNIIRTPQEKLKIINEYLSEKTGIRALERKYKTGHTNIYRWIKKYEAEGIKGLESNSGKSKGGNKGIGIKKPKSKIEELELEIIKRDIEIARLKKGYTVKGVGAKKEFVITFDKNIK